MWKKLVALTLVCLMFAPYALADKTLHLTFTGDVTLGSEEKKRNKPDSFVQTAEREGYEYFFSQVSAMFQADDLTVVNLEGPLTDKNTQENRNKTYRFRGPRDYVNILKIAGIEACNISNNHCPLDFGNQGLNSTKETLEQAQVGWFGGTGYWIFEKDGLKIAFFGLNSTKVNGNKKWFRETIPHLKEEEGVNAVVFVFHAGSEYSKKHTGAQTEYAHMAIDAGADLVIMHHPHVVQGLDVYKNRTICYSLGNFCFGGNSEVRAVESVIAGVDLTFDDEGHYIGQQLTLYPAHISGTEEYNNYQPILVTGEEAQGVMALIQYDTAYEIAPYTDEAGCAVQPYLPAEGAAN